MKHLVFFDEDKKIKNVKNIKKEEIGDEKEEKSYVGLNTEYQVSYLYLLRKRQFVNDKSPVYKIRRTTQNPDTKIGRFGSYDKGSEICLLIKVLNDKVVNLERIVKDRFKETFKNHIDGSESFEGDENLMIRIIIDTVNYN
jgi:hypothetical protein